MTKEGSLNPTFYLNVTKLRGVFQYRKQSLMCLGDEN